MDLSLFNGAKDTKMSMTSRQERGKRVRSLRLALRLSRKALGKIGSIPVGSIQNWEEARYGGLTEKGALKLVRAFQAEGLQVTTDWLLSGIGIDPLEAPPIISASIGFNHSVDFSSENIIAQELQLFHQLNPGSIDAIIPDEAMLPWLSPGDYVAGKRYFDEEIKKAIESFCIVQTLNGEVLVRQLKNNLASGVYSLVGTNPNIQKNVIENVKLFSAAPILWIRKPE